MTGYRLDLTDVNAMLLAQLDPEVTTFQAACTWLKEHEERWQSWLPDKTKCFEGFGLQDMDGNFVENRAIAGLTCTVCPAGYYSRQLDDYEKGLTHVCIPCASGTYQESAASLSCNPCPIGEYQEMLGSKSCKRCGLGLYQDERGQSNCMLCPAGTTTLGLGSLSAADCECREGSINVNVEVVNAKIQCQQCGEGLRCPFSSSIDTLLQGDASLGPEYTPELVLGYTSSAFKPLEIFKCVSNCPGGKPGVCDGGRQGLTCAECAAGKVWKLGFRFSISLLEYMLLLLLGRSSLPLLWIPLSGKLFASMHNSMLTVAVSPISTELFLDAPLSGMETLASLAKPRLPFCGSLYSLQLYLRLLRPTISCCSVINPCTRSYFFTACPHKGRNDSCQSQ